MVKNKGLVEVKATDFWKLEDAVREGRTENIVGGQLKKVDRTDGVLYSHGGQNWLMSHKGVYFAHPKLIKRLL